MKLGTETGSFNNWMMAQYRDKPEVGMGATILSWTDRYPATIVKVTPNQIHVQEDLYVRTDSNGMSEHQEYDYVRNEKAMVEVFRWTKRGWKNKRGQFLSVGQRERYYDFSF